jgi:hypothetical protein
VIFLANESVDNISLSIEVNDNAQGKLQSLNETLDVFQNTLEYTIESLKEFENTFSALSNIANIEINVNTQELDNAISRANELSETLERVPTNDGDNANLDTLLERIEELEDEVDRLNDRSRRTFNNFGRSANTANNALSKLFKAIKRIALYRAIRTVLNQIQQGFKEGANNAYQYSKAIGGEFAANMDKLATSSQYLKNGLGALSSELLGDFTPVLIKIADKLAVVSNAIARFFAALQGKKTVIQAVKAFKEYASATDKATKANKGALASFDEINNITTSSTSDSSTSGQDYSKMFETVELDAQNDKLVAFANKIRELTKDLTPLQKALLVVGIALSSWLIIKTITNLFTKAKNPIKTVSTGFSNFLSSLGKATEAIAILGGLALVISSITNLINAFSESGLTLGEVAGLLGIVLGEVTVAFAALMAVMKFLEPSWKSIAAAVVIFIGLNAVIKSLTSLIDALGKSGLSVNQMFGDMTAILIPVVGIITALTVAAMILATNPLALVGVLAVAASLSLVLVALGKAIPPIIDSMTKFASAVAPYVIQMINIIVNAIKSIPDFITRLGNSINNFVDSVIKAVTKLVNFIVSAIEYLINITIIKGVNGIIKSINSVSKYVGITIPLVADVSFKRFNPKLYENGGFPDYGEMFIARENGAELVGTIGGRTAVVNNDQIVSAVSAGVYSAVVDAMSKTNGNSGDTVVTIDGREVFRAVRNQNNNYRRQTGTSAF